MEKILLLLMAVVGTWAHGRLLEPPSRASAWRAGFLTPIDYNDNEAFCGGFSHQYSVNGGKCGICGDAWDAEPRQHEVGGLYATGTIVRQYEEGQVIRVTSDITSNHRGHFEVRICPDPEVEATQECLDKHQLEFTDGSGYQHPITTAVGNHSFQVTLPRGFTCVRCVLQWRYVTGNNWGICPDGSGALGCGPQEEFRACADVSVLPTNRNRWSPYDGSFHGLSASLPLHSSAGSEGRLSPLGFSDVQCEAQGERGKVPGMDVWCTKNCLRSAFCPEDLCKCF